jgi:hypothetical protein
LKKERKVVTEAEKTLQWFNDHVKVNGTYPLIADVEKRLNDAVNAEKQVKIIEIDTKIQLLPRKWYQIYKRGWQTHADIFGRRYFVRYHWIK